MDVGPGTLVKVVDADGRGGWPAPLYLALDQIWTIAEVCIDFDGDIVVRLKGYDHASEDASAEAYLRAIGDRRSDYPPRLHTGFACDRFRPIRKPPIPAEILALQTPTPADAESVREAEGV